MKTRRGSDAMAASTPAPTSSNNTTATGRIERKRAHDREAQRASRAKTKAYIAHLEKTVAELTAASGDDDRAHYLAQHATKQSQEIESLQGLVNKIRTMIQDSGKLGLGLEGLDGLKPESPPADSGDHSHHHQRAHDSPAYHSPPGAGGSSNSSSSNGHHHHNSADSPPKSPASTEIPRSGGPTVVDASSEPAAATNRHAGATRNLVVLGESLLCEDTDDRSFFYRLNRVIEQLEASPDHLSTAGVDADILIRALIHGWDAAERVHHFDIVWRFLRAFDEGFWYRAGLAERAAHHWLMRSTMLHKMCPRNQPRRATPAFMNPTFRQLVGRGPDDGPPQPLADYYAWPRVRDLVLDRGGLDITGRTSIAFIRAIRFDWPYAARDLYRDNARTGLYELSPTFLEKYHRLESYKLEDPQRLPLTSAAVAADTLPSTTLAAPPLHPAQACAATTGLTAEALLGWHTEPSPLENAVPEDDGQEHGFSYFATTTARDQRMKSDASSIASSSSSTSSSANTAPTSVGNSNSNTDGTGNVTPSSLLKDPSSSASADAAAAAAASLGMGIDAWMPGGCGIGLDGGASADAAAFLEFAMEAWPVV